MHSTSKPKSKSTLPLLVAESILGFVWWSTFVEFLSTLWFFPLEKMDFSGWEVFLAAYVLVIFVGITALRNLFQLHTAIVRLFALLLALFAFYPWDVKNPPFPVSYFPEANAARMAFVSLGVTIDLLASLSVWWSSQPDRRERSAWGFFLGLLVLLIVRLEWTTLNPITLWKGPIIFAAIALVWASYTLNSEVISTTVSYDLSTFTKWNEDSTRVALASPFSVGFGLASQLFITHLLYTTHGVAARYLDIDPFPSGIFVVFAFFIGAFFSGKTELVSSPGWFLSTAGLGISLFLIGEYGDGHFLSYLGFFGVLLLAVYLASSWPRVASNFSSTTRPGRAAAWFVLGYLIFTFWAVWVVAFKFIPWYLGSGVLKERNRSMVALAVVLASLANTNWKKSTAVDSDNKARRASKNTSIKRDVSILLVILFLAGFVPTTIHRLSRAPRNVVAPGNTPGQPSIINGMIWNIHFGYDNFGRNNFYGITEQIRQRNINVLGILESDTTRPITANIDVVEFLAEHLNMYSDFGPSTAKNTWGCGLLSAYPIEKLERIVLPSPEGELACLIDAVINVDGELVTVLVTHFGNTEDVLDRKLQTEGLAQAAAQTPYPAVVLSYITDKPHSENYNHILRVGGLKDTTADTKRYCEYIFYKGLEQLDFYRYAGDTLSDTEAQVGSWKLLPKK